MRKETKVKIKARGLSAEETRELHDVIRRMNRRRKHLGKDRISYELNLNTKKYVTQN